MRHELPGDHRAFFFVLDGRGERRRPRLREGEIGWSDPVAGSPATSHLDVATGDADGLAQVMVYSGRPVGEPITIGGPFVMNTRAEVEQAYADFRSGRFGPVPRQARLQQR